MAFGPKGVIAASFDRILHFIDSQSGRMLEAIDSAHDAAITQLTWRPELATIGAAIATCHTSTFTFFQPPTSGAMEWELGMMPLSPILVTTLS